nr:hypothetical protein [Tanacetum cinerariifolium]
MLDRSDFELKEQRIRLYCLGKENEENILKSIDKGPFKMGKFRETLAEGALHLGPERDIVFADLTQEEKERFTKLINDVRNIKMIMPKMQLNSMFVNNMFPEWGRFMTAVKLNRGMKTSNYDQLYAYLKQQEAHAENMMMLERYNQHAIDLFAFGRQNRGQGDYVRGAVAAGNGGVQNRVGNANPGQAKQIKCYNCNGTKMFDDDVDEAPVQDLTILMENLSSADLIYDEAGPSYDSDILSEVQDPNNYVDSVGEYHKVHEMQNDVQLNYVVDSNVEYTSDSNIISYEQYVKDNAVQVVQIKSTHAYAIVHDSEDTLELAETTRIKMLEKSKSALWVDSKIKIAPPNYSKENYLATFTPHKHLTPEHIFWSEDVHKHLTNVPKPTTALMVYPPNTPEHFEGIQMALVKEVKEMKKIEQMEAEVEQNAMDKQCANIERKNILIENENLIADCLSNELFYSVMNDVNTISRFFELHDAYTVEQTQKVTSLKEQNELFRAENEKVKRHYKELYDSIKIIRAKTIEKTASLFTKNEKLKAQLKGKMPYVLMPAVKPKVLAPGMYAIDVEPILPHNRNNRKVHLDYLKHLKESVETLREIVEEAKIQKPLDNALKNASFYAKRSPKLL